MKQVLGRKEHNRCESMAGRAYQVCYVNEAISQGFAECWIDDSVADLVAYTGAGLVQGWIRGKAEPTAMELLTNELKQLVAQLVAK